MEQPLSELCDIKHGYAFEGEFFTNEGEYVLLNPGNFFKSGGYRDRGPKQKFYTGEIPRDYVLNEGDLLAAMTEQAAALLGTRLIGQGREPLHIGRVGLEEFLPVSGGRLRLEEGVESPGDARWKIVVEEEPHAANFTSNSMASRTEAGSSSYQWAISSIDWPAFEAA